METSEQGCCVGQNPQAMCSHPGPEEYLRLRARFFRDQAHDLEQLADALKHSPRLSPQSQQTLARIIGIGLAHDGRF